MAVEDTAPEFPTPVVQPISSRGEFHTEFRHAMAQVAQLGCRHLCWCDTDFADWPLNDSAIIDALSAWALPHRQLTVMAAHFDEFPRRHARWIGWRQRWSHVVECRILEELEPQACPTLLLAEGLLVLRLVDPIRHRGTLSFDAADGLRGREQIDALLQRSVEAFPATTLGL